MKLALILASTALLSAQTTLDFPMSMVVARDGSFLVLNAGSKPSVRVMSGGEVPLDDAWLGLALAPDGKTVYASGGVRGSVYELSYSKGELKLLREMKASGFVGDVAVSPDGHLIYAADLFGNAIIVINPQSGRVIDRFKTGRRPYRILFHPDGQSFFVSSWADAAVYQYRTVNGEELGRIRLGPHPTDMVISDRKPMVDEGQPAPEWKYRLFVAAANTNSVFAVGIGENKTMNQLEAIHVAPAPLTPLGMTPSALALSPDQTHLYVACSDAGAVADVNISDVRSVVEGFAPAGIYPVATHVLRDGRILALDAKGNMLRALGTFGILPEPKSEQPALAPAEHVIYVLPNLAPEEFMHAVAGIAPDFTVKLGRRPVFDASDPANTPPAGYLWTNAIAAGLTVRNYGVPLRDPALRPFTNPRGFQGFVDDLKEFETAGKMPNLLLIAGGDQAAIETAVAKSRFRNTTKIVAGGDLRTAEALLGLRPMTRKD